jgi:hypothetical protein
MKTLENQFEALLDELSPCLMDTDIEQARELLAANELGVAFENFCTQLGERDVVCIHDQIVRLASIGLALGISPAYWQHLENR